MNALLLITTIVLLLAVQGSSAHADDAVIRRRDSLDALFRGFLCYIKGDTLEECQHDRSVLNIIRRLDDRHPSEDVTNRIADSESRIVQKAGLPLPPQDARKRDAFYSDWKRK